MYATKLQYTTTYTVFLSLNISRNKTSIPFKIRLQLHALPFMNTLFYKHRVVACFGFERKIGHAKFHFHDRPKMTKRRGQERFIINWRARVGNASKTLGKVGEDRRAVDFIASSRLEFDSRLVVDRLAITFHPGIGGELKSNESRMLLRVVEFNGGKMILLRSVALTWSRKEDLEKNFCGEFFVSTTTS